MDLWYSGVVYCDIKSHYMTSVNVIWPKEAKILYIKSEISYKSLISRLQVIVVTSSDLPPDDVVVLAHYLIVYSI